jgi:hypothetical protein
MSGCPRALYYWLQGMAKPNVNRRRRMRRVAVTRKKLRGIPRRLRALAKWPSSFEGSFPSGLGRANGFVNYKLAVHEALVDGKSATLTQRRAAAQSLLDACAHLIAAKPPGAASFRVVATVCLPRMFPSEVCIYTDEEYFQEMVRVGQSRHGATKRIEGRILAGEWGLTMSATMREFGLAYENMTAADPDDRCAGEYWFFGEV